MKNTSIQPDQASGRATGRLSLRTMVFILLGVGGVVILIFMAPYFSQERFLRELEGKGVSFTRHQSHREFLPLLVGKLLGIKPPPIAFNGPVVEIDRGRISELRIMKHLLGVDIESGRTVSGGDSLWWLSECTRLQSLTITARISDDDLRSVSHLKNLEYLLIDATGLNGVFLDHLPVGTLNEMRVQDADADEAWAIRLGALTSLNTVYFENSTLHAPTVLALLNLKSITELNITNCTIGWPDAPDVSASPLREIWLDGDDGLSGYKVLSRLPQLGTLGLMSHKPEIAGLAELAKSTSLNKLVLPNADDEKLAVIVSIKSLTELNLTGTGMTSRGFAHLAGMDNLTKLSLEGPTLDDAAVEHLVGLKSLTTLELSDVKISDSGFAQLVKRLNLRKLRISSDSLTSKAMEALVDKISIQFLDVDESLINGLPADIMEKIRLVNPLLKFGSYSDDQ